jgi:hypothetical protein
MNACAGLTGVAAKTEALISVPTCEFSKPAREKRVTSLCDLSEQLECVRKSVKRFSDKTHDKTKSWSALLIPSKADTL